MRGRFFDHQTDQYVDWIWATFFMFPRNVLKAFSNKRLPDDFFMYYEDVLWCYRIKNSGYKIFYYSQTKVIHHLSKSLEKTDSPKTQLILNNEWTFLKREKGILYAYFFFLLRGLVFLSQRELHLRTLGKKYFHQIIPKR